MLLPAGELKGSGWALPAQTSSGWSPAKVHLPPAHCVACHLPHGGGQSLTSLLSWAHQAGPHHPLPLPGHHAAHHIPCPLSYLLDLCPWSQPLGGGLPSSTAVHIVGAWSLLALVQSFVHSTVPRNASLEPSGQHTLPRPMQTDPLHLPKPASVSWGPWEAAYLPCLLLSLALHILGLSRSKCSLCPLVLGPPQLRSLPCFSW